MAEVRYRVGRSVGEKGYCVQHFRQGERNAVPRFICVLFGPISRRLHVAVRQSSGAPVGLGDELGLVPLQEAHSHHRKPLT